MLSFGEKEVLVTTDLLLEGIHFDLRYVPLKHLGYKAAIVNFSDIYAVNGNPKQITVSLGLFPLHSGTYRKSFTSESVSPVKSMEQPEALGEHPEEKEEETRVLTSHWQKRKKAILVRWRCDPRVERNIL